MAVMLCAGFAACGDDDNDEGGSGTVEAQALVDNDGNQVRITSVGDVEFNYDKKGRLVSFGNDDETYVINGSTITAPGTSYEYKLSTNSKGYITKMVISYNEKYDNGEYEKGSGTVSISYNGDGEITAVAGTGTSEYKEVYQGEVETGSEKSTVSETFTWSNGNLKKIVSESKGSYIEDGEPGSYSSVDTYTFTYGKTANVCRQYPYYVGNNVLGEGAGLLALAGFFGVGTAYLPTGYTDAYTETYYDEKPYSNSKSYTLTYTLNSNGTIDTEKRDNGKTIQYGYSDVTRAAMLANEVEAQLPALKNMIFKRHRR